MINISGHARIGWTRLRFGSFLHIFLFLLQSSCTNVKLHFNLVSWHTFTMVNTICLSLNTWTRFKPFAKDQFTQPNKDYIEPMCVWPVGRCFWQPFSPQVHLWYISHRATPWQINPTCTGSVEGVFLCFPFVTEQVVHSGVDQITTSGSYCWKQVSHKENEQKVESGGS